MFLMRGNYRDQTSLSAALNDRYDVEPSRAELYVFTPTTNEFERLKIFNEMREDSNLKAIVRRRSLVIVIAKYSNWWYIICSGYAGWALFPSAKVFNKQNNSVLTYAKSFRRYEDWRGNNYFLFDGKLLLGSDAKCLSISNSLLLLPAFFLFKDVAPYVSESKTHIYGIYLVGIFMLFVTFYNLWMTALTEPGILPRNEPHIRAELPSNANTVGPNSWKFCETCNIYRPPRSKHCTSCQNCVEVFDHHCPWTGNCVAKRNYKYFYCFIIFVTAFSVYAVALCTIVLIKNYFKHDGNVEFLIENPFALAVGIVSFICAWSLVSLCCYHIYLVYRGETTNENLRGLSPNNNPRFMGNCIDLCCNSVEPSLLPDQSEMVTADEYINSFSDLISVHLENIRIERQKNNHNSDSRQTSTTASSSNTSSYVSRVGQLQEPLLSHTEVSSNYGTN